jgi:hypothetical protein
MCEAIDHSSVKLGRSRSTTRDHRARSVDLSATDRYAPIFLYVLTIFQIYDQLGSKLKRESDYLTNTQLIGPVK